MTTSQNGTILHNGQVRPVTPGREPNSKAPPPPTARPVPTAAHPQPTRSTTQRVEPQPKSIGRPSSAPSPTPTDSLQLAATTKVPWGKFKGKSLAELSGSEEGRSYLYFLAYKNEPRSESDKALQAAAGEMVKQAVAEQLQAALVQPDAAMPLLPFGDEKGKRLHQAHPKWVAMLAKKQDGDARSFADLVLYTVARHLQAERGPAAGFRRSGGLSDEQFAQLLDELKGIRSALEKWGSQ